VDGWNEALPDGASMSVNNLPGQGSLRALNELMNADPDGHTVGYTAPPGHYTLQILGEADFQLQNSSWVDRISNGPVILQTWGESEYDTVKKLQNADTTFRLGIIRNTIISLGAVLVLEALGGIDYSIVAGFGGAGEMYASLQRDEIDLMVMTAGGTQPQQGKINPLVYTGTSDDPQIQWNPDIPTMGDFGMGDMEGVVATQRSVTAPPGVEDDRLEVLRETFTDATDMDSVAQAFEEANRGFAPLDGEEMEQVATNQFQLMQDSKDTLEDALG